MFVSVFVLCGMVWNAAADDGSCRIHIQETFKKSETTVGKKLDVSDIPVASRADCKSEAMNRKIASASKEDVVAVKAYFSFKEASIY